MLYYDRKHLLGPFHILGGVSLLTVPLTGYRNGKIVNCLFSKTTIKASAVLIVVFKNN